MKSEVYKTCKNLSNIYTCLDKHFLDLTKHFDFYSHLCKKTLKLKQIALTNKKKTNCYVPAKKNCYVQCRIYLKCFR